MAPTQPADMSSTGRPHGRRGTAGRRGPAPAHDARPRTRAAGGKPDLDDFFTPARRALGPGWAAAAPPERRAGVPARLSGGNGDRAMQPVRGPARALTG